jgi:ribosome-associated protein
VNPAASRADSEERVRSLASAELAGVVVEYALDRKAHDVVELDMRGLVGYTDYFVICSGNTDRQVKAIHDAIIEGCKREHGIVPRRVEGLGSAQWVLVDLLDVVVHIFTPATREFYRLEQLWGEAPTRTVEKYRVAPE